MELFSNFGSSLMVTPVLNPGDTSMALTPGSGALFPSPVAGDFFRVVMVDSLSNPTKREVIFVTTRLVDSFTVMVRGQEGTVAQTWVAGNFVILRVTKGMLEALQSLSSATVLAAALASTTDPALGDAMIGFRQSNPAGFLPSAVGSTVDRKLRDIYSQSDWGITGDGVTNDAPALNTAITALNGIGGGTIVMRGNVVLGTTIRTQSNVMLDWFNATFTFTGGAIPVFDSAVTGVLVNAGVINANGNMGTASHLFAINSCYDCHFEHCYVTGANVLSVVQEIAVNAAGGLNPEGNRNSAKNSFSNIKHFGTCGVHTRLRGNGAGAVVTVNTFSDNQAASCAIAGIEHVQWSDNNSFPGNNRWGITAVNAIGVVENTGNPTVNVGVYGNTYGHHAVDAFGGPFAGRRGVVLNNCSQFKMERLYQDPVAEGGQYVVTQYAHGYDFNVATAGGTGATQVTDNAYVIYNAFDGAGNYERCWLKFVAGEFLIFTDNAGTGTVRPLKWGVNGAVQWGVNISGHMHADTNDTYDFGVQDDATPANRKMARNGFFARKIVAKAIQTLTFGANIAIDASLANSFVVTATSGIAFQFDNPTNPSVGQMIRIRLVNTSGGALGAITFGGQYKNAAFTAPATGFSRTMEFYWDGTNWRQGLNFSGDIPN